MKCISDKRVIIPFLLLMLTILGSCMPVTTEAANQQAPTSSLTLTEAALTLTEPLRATVSPTASETRQPTQTDTPTASETLPALPLLPTVKPARTKRTLPRKSTETPQPTQTLTPTASETEQLLQTLTPVTATCPPNTPEILWVEPVTSPTDQFTQVILVHIGNGEEVTVSSESGTFSVTGDFGDYAGPAAVEITLLPNTEHHLEVIAKVRHVPSGNGCLYGGYDLRTTVDKQGAPLTIVQGTPIP